MARSGVKFVDKGLARIVASVARTGSRSVHVGLVGAVASEIHHDDITVTEVGLINEFGSRAAGVPERSFLRSTLAENRTEFKNFTGYLARLIVIGSMTPDRALDTLGQVFAEKVRHKILDNGGVQPGNADSTIRQKGFDHPLLETGHLASAISYVVVSEPGHSGNPIDHAEPSGDYASYEVNE